MKKYNHTLIIDDDPISCFINQKMIETVELTQNMQVVNNGAEALNYIKSQYRPNGVEKENLDLIFLDLNMPVMDGFEFLQLFESLDERYWINVDVVVLTSSNNQLDISSSNNHRVKAYLNKPLTTESLKKVFEY